MGSFFSDTFFKSFSSKYVYVEVASTTVAPSICTLSHNVQFFLNPIRLSDYTGCGGGGRGGMMATSE